MDFEDPTRTARDGQSKLAAFFRSIGMPTNLRELDARFTMEDIPALTAKVKRKPDGKVGWFRPLGDADIIAIYESAFDWKD
jgi:alcohol dehydrogenase YqhD (iron-dependent ADH family)